jgi:hypothetical protein
VVWSEWRRIWLKRDFRGDVTKKTVYLNNRECRMIVRCDMRWHDTRSMTLDKAIAGQAGQSEGCNGQQNSQDDQR